MGLLRGPAVRERAAGRPQRAPPGDQGRLQPLPDDEGPLRPAEGRLGLPRPARPRSRSRRQLGFTHKREIVEYGIEKFNNLCRTSVSEYIAGYVKFSDRIAFWLDYEDAYETIRTSTSSRSGGRSPSCTAKGLLFEADRVAPYCPRCETPLSDHELGHGGRLPGGLRPRRHRSRSRSSTPTGRAGRRVARRLDDHTVDAHREPRRAPSAPTSPTRSSSTRARGSILAEALRRERARSRDAAAGRCARSAAASSSACTTGRRSSTRSARSADVATRGRCCAGDFVDVDEGTGIVHMAGAFGADDLAAVRAAGHPDLQPGRRERELRPTPSRSTQGTFVKDADERIIERLRSDGVLVRSEPHVHSLPALLAVQVAAAATTRSCRGTSARREKKDRAARRERERQLGPRPHQARALRQLAREQRRLVACRASASGGRRCRSGGARTRTTSRSARSRSCPISPDATSPGSTCTVRTWTTSRSRVPSARRRRSASRT